MQDVVARAREDTILAIKPRRPETLAKKLTWTIDALPEFYWLCENPPLHSVVATIHPEVAKVILTHHNGRNRPMGRAPARRYENELLSGDFALTGDTLKFDRDGNLLDGQHRLQACVSADKPFISHIVFGIDARFFDLLDLGKARSSADVLAIEGIAYASQTASAARWVMAIVLGLGQTDGATMAASPSNAYRQIAQMTPRRIREMVSSGELAGLSDWCPLALQIYKAFKHPSAMMAAILYLIARRSPHAAAAFVHEWIHGQRSSGRNQTFDVLSRRLINIQNAQQGRIDRQVRCALIIIAWNYWQANDVPSMQAMNWRRGQPFPELKFSAKPMA